MLHLLGRKLAYEITIEDGRNVGWRDDEERRITIPRISQKLGHYGLDGQRILHEFACEFFARSGHNHLTRIR
jgi:hypothetical protein